MELDIDLWSDGAMLACFDPVACQGERFSDSAYPLHESWFVQDGHVALVSLPDDGTYRLRITDIGLSELRELVHQTVGPFGVRVTSGRVYVSGMDLPPSDAATLQAHGAGHLVEVESGNYNVLFHSIRSERPEVPDYVAVFSVRDGAFQLPEGNLSFEGITPEAIQRIIGEPLGK